MIAHEVGHHVQNLLGILPKAQQAQRAAGDKAEANRIQVRVELQADCFAGVWAHHAEQRWKLLEPGDIEAALQTAAAIGDDTLQKQSQGCVVPDSFTHGSSAQRQRWFMTGFKSGNVKACNTFAAGQVASQSMTTGRPVGQCAMPGIDETRQFVPLKIAVLTVSDTRAGSPTTSPARRWPSASRRRATLSPGARSSPTTSRRSARRCEPGSPTRRSTWSSPPAAPASPAAM